MQALRFRDEAVAGAARHFEVAERERAGSVARALNVFASRQGEFYASQLQTLESFSQVPLRRLLRAMHFTPPDWSVCGIRHHSVLFAKRL